MNLNKIHQWTDKINITGKVASISGMTAALFILFLRLRPYFIEKVVVHAFTHEKGEQGKKSQNKRVADGENQLDGKKPREAGGHAQINIPKDRIIERPLFDGKIVILKAVLLQTLTSKQNDGELEAQLLRDGDLSSSFDASLLEEATLIGHGNPNFDTKRYELQFGELITKMGRHYTVSAYAIDQSLLVGIPARYSSGLASRLAGSAINRTVQVGENIATGKLVDSSGSSTAANIEANQAISETGKQGSNELADELTKDLKSTKPELSLPAGTIFSIKLKAQSSGGGVQ
jgi:hypothetical protein